MFLSPPLSVARTSSKPLTTLCSLCLSFLLSLGKFTLFKETKWCNSRHGTPLPRPRFCILSDYVCNTSHGLCDFSSISALKSRGNGRCSHASHESRSRFTLIVFKSNYHDYFHKHRVRATSVSSLLLPWANNCSKVRPIRDARVSERGRFIIGEDARKIVCCRKMKFT